MKPLVYTLFDQERTMRTHTITHIAVRTIALTIIVLSLSFAQGTVTVSSPGNVIARRTSPDSVLAQVNAGTVLTVLQMDEQWVKVAIPGNRKSGWLKRETLSLPDPDVATIARDWPLFEHRGSSYTPADTTGAKTGFVRKGMTARRLRLQGDWFELELDGGLTGWVPQHVIEPSIMDVMTVNRRWTAVPDTLHKRAGSRADVKLEETNKVIPLARGINWVKVRTSDGREGWVEPYVLDVAGAMPVQAKSVVLYRAFDALDKFGDTNFLLGVLVFALQWIVLPMLPAVLVYLLYYPAIGSIKFINNWIVKAGFGILAVVVAFYFVFSFLPMIPPFVGGFRGGFMQFWAAVIEIGAITGFLRRISYDRCNKCRRIGAGKIGGIAGGSSSERVDTVKTTYGYADGHTSTSTAETTSRSNTISYRVRCQYCGHGWIESETTTSRVTVKK